MMTAEKKPKRAEESIILHALFVSAVVPFILQEISSAGGGFVDALIVSQILPAADLAVQGMGNPYFSIMGVVSGMIVTGMQTICAKAYGKGEIDHVNRTFSLAAVIGGVLSLILTAAMVFAGDQIGSFLGATGESADLLPSLKMYLMGLGVGTFPVVLASMLMPLVQMEGGGKALRTAVVAGFIINILGDLSVPMTGTGMLGMGLATSISELVQLMILVAYLVKKKSTIHFSLKGLMWIETGSMLWMGLPKATRRAANLLRPLMLNRLVILLGGSIAMSAMSIRNSLDGIGDVVGAGVASTVMLMIGILYGEENKDGVRQISLLTIKYIICFVSIVGTVFFIAAPYLASFYTNGDVETANIATFAIRCMAVDLLLKAFLESYVSMLQATEQMWKTHVANILSRFVYIAACAFILGHILGIRGVWLSFPLGSLLMLITIFVYSCLRKKSLAITLYDILGLPDDFGADEADILSYTITSVEEGYLSRKNEIYNFCADHGFSKRTAYHSALCLEEMVRNIVEHGFPLDNKSHSVDVRVVAKGEELIIRVRDDCPLFNVKEKGQKWKMNPADPAAHIGIRLTMAAAKELKYINTLGTNTLIIVN